jgi:hypothetical protein
VKINFDLAFTSPKSGQSVSNALLAVAGTVADKAAVTNVSYQLNGNGWRPAASANSWSNWTAGLTLNPGTNTLSAYAQDVRGAVSPTVSVKVIYNLFLDAQGTYNGLFAPANAQRQQTNSGAFTFSVSSAGALSGKLTIGSSASSLKGQFGPAGAVTLTTARPGESSLSTTLQLDFVHQSVSGAVSDGSFTAPLYGDRDVFSKSSKAAEFAGQYTLIIPGTNDAAVGPYGLSYGTVTVSAEGAITFAGSLADGTAVSQSSVVSQDGYWPFYLPLYNGKGSLYSWNNFTNNVTNGTIILAAGASWINETNSSASAAYKAGFTNNATVIYASAYTTNLLKLPDGMGQVVLEGGGLSTIITNSISLGANDKITVTTNADKMALTINKTTGVISGTFTNGSKTIKVNGVLFQSQTNAQGYFLGPNQTSGTFNLSPP